MIYQCREELHVDVIDIHSLNLLRSKRRKKCIMNLVVEKRNSVNEKHTAIMRGGSSSLLCTALCLPALRTKKNMSSMESMEAVNG